MLTGKAGPCAALLAAAVVFTWTGAGSPRPAEAQGPAGGQSDPASSPATFITRLANGALQSISEPGLSPVEKQRRFRTLLVDDFDVPRIARFTLGRYWNEASPEQRADFTKLLEDYLVTAYAARFTDYSGSSFRALGTRTDEQGTLVLSEMLRTGGAPVKVSWRLETAVPPFKIYDVFIENVSMAVTQRSEFASVIQRSGGRVEDLISVLRRKLSDGGTG